MSDMEAFLPNFPQLKYLELQAHGMSDLVDGNRWQRLTSSLFKFNLIVKLQDSSYLESLDTFRTTFWLEEKHWYVAYQNKCLFSVPHFASNQIEIPIQSPVYSTVPDDIIIYNRITKVIINSVPVDTSIWFTNVKTLVFKCSISIDVLSSIVDLNQIEHLTILHIEDLSKLLPFEWRMPRLCQISIVKPVTIDMIRRVKHYQMKNIRKLEIAIKVQYYRFIIENVFILFPNIKHLSIRTSRIESIKSIVHIIDRFDYLSNLSLYSTYLTGNLNTIIYNNTKSIVYLSRRLTENNFTCRINSSSTSTAIYNVNWWIDVKVNVYFLYNKSIINIDLFIIL
jgi:hypothetical protein